MLITLIFEPFFFNSYWSYLDFPPRNSDWFHPWFILKTLASWWEEPATKCKVVLRFYGLGSSGVWRSGKTDTRYYNGRKCMAGTVFFSDVAMTMPPSTPCCWCLRRWDNEDKWVLLQSLPLQGVAGTVVPTSTEERIAGGIRWRTYMS